MAVSNRLSKLKYCAVTHGAVVIFVCYMPAFASRPWLMDAKIRRSGEAGLE